MNWYSVATIGSYFDSGTTSTQWASLFASYGLFDAAPEIGVVGGSIFLNMFLLL